MQDIKEQNLSEKLQSLQIEENLINDSLLEFSDDYFKNATRKICELANVRIAVITECISYSNTRVKTLAFYNHNSIMENFEYDVANTPCEKIVDGESCFYPSNIQKLFPKDIDLVKLNVKSYCAVPLN